MIIKSLKRKLYGKEYIWYCKENKNNRYTYHSTNGCFNPEEYPQLILLYHGESFLAIKIFEEKV